MEISKHIRIVCLALLCFAMPGCLAFGQQQGGEDGGAVVPPSANGDSLFVSLLTCSPGVDAYAMFGHTALRVRQLGTPTDVVYNYGVFDSRQENFIWHFVIGHTDYELRPQSAQRFFGRYLADGQTVWEQVLCLTAEQRAMVQALLDTNALPENRTYRYNFLYDNCSTRVRDMLERLFGNASPSALADAPALAYAPVEEKTQREMLHEFTASAPWTAFGIDMVLGMEVDQPIGRHEQMFLPSYLQRMADEANVCTDSTEAPFVLQTLTWQPETPATPAASFPIGPKAAFWLLFALALGFTYIDYRRQQAMLWFDIVLYIVQGTAGIIIAGLFFCSEHPAVGTNLLVFVFNPLVFLMIPNLLRWRRKHKPLISLLGMDMLEVIYAAAIIVLLLLYVLPLQWLHPALLPLALTLLMRSVLHLALARKM